MFHSMYSLVDDGKDVALIKLTVEQIDDYDGSRRTRRAYKLTNVEEALTQRNGLQPSHTRSASSRYTVADLYSFVKQYDSTFIAKPSSKIVNKDGSPKIVYHGTASDFWAFDHKKANDITGRRLGLGAGKGKFYLTEYKGSGNAAAISAQEMGKGGQARVMELYVSAQKVMDRSEYDSRLQEMYAKYPNSNPHEDGYDYRQRDKAIAALDKAVRKEGYDCALDKESGELFVYEATQMKSATDNVGLFDPENKDIRYSLRETEDMSWEEQVSKAQDKSMPSSATLSLGQTGIKKPDILWACPNIRHSGRPGHAETCKKPASNARSASWDGFH